MRAFAILENETKIQYYRKGVGPRHRLAKEITIPAGTAIHITSGGQLWIQDAADRGKVMPTIVYFCADCGGHVCGAK